MSKAAELANLIGNINAGGGGTNRNVIINGAMNVAQRGTSSTGLGADADTIPTCDRWYHSASSTAGRFTMTQDSSAPSGFANSLKLACTTADTSIAAGEVLLLRQKLEGQNVQMFAKGTSDAKPYALSFYVKGNASATYVAELMDNDNSNRHVNKTFSVTTDWTRVELSLPADTTGALDDDNANSLDLNIWLHAGSNRTSGSLQTTWGALAQANRCVGISSFFSSTSNTFFITGVQLEVGQNPTEFEHEPYDVTWHKCQRYFQHLDCSEAAYTKFINGQAIGSNQAAFCLQLRPHMRSIPTLTVTDVSDLAVATSSGGASGITALSLDGNSDTSHSVILDTGSTTSGLTAGHATMLVSENDTSPVVDLSAEL